MLEEQGAAMRLKGPTENLFLAALSLDPLCGLEVPLPSSLESEKKFPRMKEVTPATANKLLMSLYLCCCFKHFDTKYHKIIGGYLSSLTSLNNRCCINIYIRCFLLLK